VSAAAGGAHTLALTADGRLWVWGSNEFGQLGDGTLSGRLTPVELTEYGGTSYAPTPGLSVPTAAYRENAFDVTVWAGTGLQIHYTFDGTDPDNEDPWVASPGQITIDQPAAFRLRAYGPGYIPSDVSGASYTLVAGLPTITPGTGSYPSGQAIQLSTVTQGAVIRYTTNGSDPTSTSALYTGDIVLASSMALRAKSFREGWGSAGIASADFVVGESAGSVAGGIDFSLALTSSGEVWAWGAGDRGQLGNGDIIDSSFPVAVSALTGIVSIAAGDAHALALDSTGTLWAWGAGDVGQLGNGNSGGNADSAVPVQVSMPTNVVAIAAGANHSLAIDDAGDVFAWGSNATGQLGDGSQANNATPALVAGFTTDVKGIAAGDGHSIALLANRRIWAWGDNFDGQVGSTAASTPQLVPIEVTGIDVPHAVVAGAFHSLALTSEGTLWAWGAGAAGQLGSGNTDDVFEPILVALSYLENRIPLVADGGAEHTLALWSDGVVRSWGSNLQGQLGRITTGDAFLPKSLPLPVKAFHVASGATHSLAVGDDGSIWAWGSNGRGQLGDWTTVQRDAPVQIASAGSLWQTAEPVLTPAPGDYADELSLTVAAYPASANVHYTTDGEEPTQLDDSVAAGGTLAIAQNADLRLKTFAVGWGPSETVSAEYRLHVATPSVLPVGDTYAGPQTVTVAVMTAGATIHYTLNGAEPTDADPGLTSGQTLDVGASATLRVKAFKDGWTPSGTVQEHYRIPLAAPIIDPAGGALTQPTLVTLSSLPGATIRYTTDGLDPNWTSTRYTSPINIGSSLTLKARAYAPGWTPSGVSEAMYTMDPGVVQAPLFSIAAGSYASEQKVVITQQTPGSVIRFTLTGIDPVASDTVIGSGSFITVDQSLSLRAKAFVVGVGESSVTRAEYAITGAIAAGGDHTLALQSDGTVLAWGSNAAGQLGDGSTIDAVLPQVVPGLTGVTAIAAGTSHSLALLSNGSLKAWGANNTGQSGIGQGQQSPFPSDVPGIVDAVRIAAAGDTSYAVLAGGAVLAWGANDTYQLGDGTGTTPSFDPVPISAFSGISIVNVSAGGAHALAVDAAGTVWAWGSDAQGQLGGTGTSGPSLVPGLAGVTAIAAGATASFALVTDGAASGVVHGWGEHRHGDTGSASSPEPLFGSVRSMDAGAAHVLAVKLAASVWAWGSNTSGQVGDGSTLDRTTPIRLFAPPGAVQVAAGTAHSLALDAQGGVWSWGANGSGQLGDGLQADHPLAAAISGVSLASGGWLAEDPDGDGLLTGEELVWGTDPYNYDTNGDGLGDGESIAAGIDPTATDVDADGLDNPTELAMGTDPFNPDTDGDGVIDGLDAFPLDPTRSELVPVNGDETPPLITIVQPDASLIP
jgi:alpha-tubulin suppressor-like RCC1 family protein